MDDKIFSISDISDCILTPLFSTEINGKTFEAGEPITIFDSLQVCDIAELKSIARASGGKGDRTRVTWETTKEVNINFANGVFSSLQLGLLGNNHLGTAEYVDIPMLEKGLEVSENNSVGLKQVPQDGCFFYLDATNERLTQFEINGKKITFNQEVKPYSKITAYYTFKHKNAEIISIGQRMFRGFLNFSAKTRIKDKETGRVTTGILMIPKLKVTSDFAIRLGENVAPSIGRFSFTAFPVGQRGNEKVMELILLNEDLDSDI